MGIEGSLGRRFPKIGNHKYVGESLDEQIANQREYVLSELDEARSEMMKCDWSAMAVEVMDTIHAAETLFDLLEKSGVSLEEAKANAKNPHWVARGYNMLLCVHFMRLVRMCDEWLEMLGRSGVDLGCSHEYVIEKNARRAYYDLVE